MLKWSVNLNGPIQSTAVTYAVRACAATRWPADTTCTAHSSAELSRSPTPALLPSRAYGAKVYPFGPGTGNDGAPQLKLLELCNVKASAGWSVNTSTLTTWKIFNKHYLETLSKSSTVLTDWLQNKLHKLKAQFVGLSALGSTDHENRLKKTKLSAKIGNSENEQKWSEAESC